MKILFFPGKSESLKSGLPNLHNDEFISTLGSCPFTILELKSDIFLMPGTWLKDIFRAKSLLKSLQRLWMAVDMFLTKTCL